MLIKLSEKLKSNIQAEYAAFIEEYIDKLSAEYTAVYLYCIKNAAKGSISLSSAAKAFGISDNDAKNIFSFFSHLKIAVIENDIITINGISSDNLPSHGKKPDYTVEEISYIKDNNEDVKRLVSESERLLGRFLSYNDLKAIYSFYDYYKLPVDVILILMEYCSSKGKRNISYIERSMLDWAENGINTVEKANARLNSFNGETVSVLKAMGITGRGLTPSESDFIKKWKTEYGFSMDMILLACEKTISSTSKASFPYADAILKNWKEKGIFTPEKARVEAEKTVPYKPKSKNQFTNFKQRNYDFNALEKKLFEKYNKPTEDK